MKRYTITTEPLSIEALIEQVKNPRAGAVCTFIGTVRELTGDKRTHFLEYEAYVEMAEKKLAQVGQELYEKYEHIEVAIAHRIGRLEIMDAAVAIAVACPHRPEAFEACRYAIDRIKEIVPIWKKEHWDDGSFWVGNQQGTIAYPEGQPPK